MTQITKDMTLGEVLQVKPTSQKVFEEWGIHCSGCPASAMETVAEGAMMHGIDIDKLIDDLNKNA